MTGNEGSSSRESIGSEERGSIGSEEKRREGE